MLATTAARRPADAVWCYDEAFARHRGLLSAAEQERLRQSRIAIAGLGGVGGVHLATLARLGIGAFHIADPDDFELANFNRQHGANVDTIGRSKAAVMAEQRDEAVQLAVEAAVPRIDRDHSRIGAVAQHVLPGDLHQRQEHLQELTKTQAALRQAAGFGNVPALQTQLLHLLAIEAFERHAKQRVVGHQREGGDDAPGFLRHQHDAVRQGLERRETQPLARLLETARLVVLRDQLQGFFPVLTVRRELHPDVAGDAGHRDRTHRQRQTHPGRQFDGGLARQRPGQHGCDRHKACTPQTDGERFQPARRIDAGPAREHCRESANGERARSQAK